MLRGKALGIVVVLGWAGCIPAPVLRARDAGGEAQDAAVVVDTAVLDAPDAAVGADVTDAGVLQPPRLMRPLSFAVVGAATPELRWSLPESATGAQVQVCEDRDCMRVSQTLDAQGNLARVPTALDQRAYFWRVRARYGERLSAYTPTWEFLVQGSSQAMVSWYGFTDFDRDGVADIVVGAPQANGGRGAVLVYRGKMDPATIPLLTVASMNSGVTGFGSAVSAGGDVDGDGRMDVIVLAQHGPDARLYVLREVNDEFRAVEQQTLSGGVGGFTSATPLFAGDMNGDGYGDVIVSPATTRQPSGEILVYLGGAHGLSNDRYIVVHPQMMGGLFGAMSVATGDQNGDQIDDIAVIDRRPGTNGTVYVVRGAMNFAAQSIVVTEIDALRLKGVGAGIARLGDVDFDGRSDFCVAASSGMGLLFSASGPGGVLTASVLSPTNTGCYKLGLVYAGGFDLTGDRSIDFVARCEFMMGNHEVAVFHGGRTQPTRAAAILRRLSGSYNRFAADIGIYGDFDADGIADVVVTTPATDASPTELSVYRGSSANGGWPAIALSLPSGIGVMDGLALSH